MTGPATETKPHDAVNGGKRLSERPRLVFFLSAGAALLLGVVSGFWYSFEISAGFFGAIIGIAIVLVVLGGSVLAVVAAVGSIKRQEVEEEFGLFFASAVLGAIIFIPILCAFVVALFVPYMTGLEEYDGGDAFSHWAGPMVIFLAGAAILSLMIGAPVGLIAWASRFARPDLEPVLRRIPDFPWPWRIGLGVPLFLGLALALGALISWLSDGYEPAEKLEAGRVDQFAVGEPRLYEEQDLWLVHLPEGEFVALYDRGVGSACPLQWRSDADFMAGRGWFVDACNGAHYDLTGRCFSDICRGALLNRFATSVERDNVVVELRLREPDHPADANATPLNPPLN